MGAEVVIVRLRYLLCIVEGLVTVFLGAVLAVFVFSQVLIEMFGIVNHKICCRHHYSTSSISRLTDLTWLITLSDDLVPGFIHDRLILVLHLCDTATVRTMELVSTGIQNIL